MKYAFIERHKNQLPIVAQCKILEVSASGFHQHRAKKATRLSRLGDTALLVHINASFKEMK